MNTRRYSLDTIRAILIVYSDKIQDVNNSQVIGFDTWTLNANIDSIDVMISHLEDMKTKLELYGRTR